MEVPQCRKKRKARKKASTRGGGLQDQKGGEGNCFRKGNGSTRLKWGGTGGKEKYREG